MKPGIDEKMVSVDRLHDMVTPSEQRESYENSGAWSGERLVDVFDRHAANAPNRVAVVDLEGTRRITYAQLHLDSRRAAAHLLSRGVNVGDVVAVQMPSWYETVVFDLAILRIGAVLSPLIPMYDVKDLAYMLDVAGTQTIVSPTAYRCIDFATRIRQTSDVLNRPLRHIAIEDPHEASQPLAFLPDIPANPVGAPAGDVSELLFTSGTESLPKAIVHSEQTLGFATRTGGAYLGLDDSVVVFMPSPLGHSTGLNYGLRWALYFGGRLVLQDRWDPALAVTLCENERVSCTSAATTFLKDMLEVLRTKRANLSAFRNFTCAGAPVPPSVVAEAASHGITVLRGYGSTETLAVAKSRPDDPLELRAHTEGRALPGVEVELRREDGSVVEDVGSGEIFVRSPATALGFAGDAQRTRRIFGPGGWVRTGDIGQRDIRGFLKLVGRTKDIIIRGGLNIAPAEVEQLLILDKRVADAIVIGLPDDRLGEIVCACVVPRGDVRPSLDDLVLGLRERKLATYKLPQRIAYFDSLPRAGTGKVRRSDMVALIEASKAGGGHV